MDVDRPSMSTSSSFEQLDPAELDLDTLNNSMKGCCHILAWQIHIGLADLTGNASMWQQLFLEVLRCHTKALAATDANYNYPDSEQ